MTGALLLWAAPAPGTVAEQRARLPPPAECDTNTVEGVWKSHQYSPRYWEWTEFTLVIRKVPGSETDLIGTITNHSWQAPKSEEQPGPCRSHLRYIVSMKGKGKFKDGKIQFGGTTWKLDKVLCGSSRGFGYNLDNFTGTVDFERQEFQTVNNDGGRAVNEPTVFRRIKCFEKPGPDGGDGLDPHIEVTPPPIFPQRRAGGGCSCGIAGGR